MVYSFVIKRCANGVWVYYGGLNGWETWWTPDASKADQFQTYESAETEITENSAEDFPEGLYQIEKVFTKK